MNKAPLIRTSNINCPRFIWYLTGVSTAWGMAGELLPTSIFKKASIVMGIVIFVIGYFTRSGKWAENRNEPPPATIDYEGSGPL